MAARYVTIGKCAQETGYTEKAIRNKIHDGTWAQEEVWVKAADGRILVDMQGYEKWVETGGAIDQLRSTLSGSRSHSEAPGIGRDCDLRPPRLT
ncbi:hypothetical protein WT81_33365 [Burkholderia stagnalis]|uniref:hypothetical protein n=1 Tax=Burkholderia stagnalis TaxID=1503054 RepID=UPI00075FECF1|nr:hypothetical protein [Burkholderia stagnalis]KWK50427.1 hypothetical protein WT80_00810 [Burkholderia stagnalis]KWK65186.1 hypothetical protein WT81_33365 [Burkholderia stagnalis]KWN76511.1 hypothetical protein WT90_00605 [Burkholderia stagnalis]